MGSACAQVEYIEDVGLITASLDSRIFIFDVNRDGVMHEVKHHRKGVSDFSYCRPYSLFGSCGERSIMLWQSQNGRLISELLGHSAPVSCVSMDNEYAPPHCAALYLVALDVSAVDPTNHRQNSSTFMYNSSQADMWADAGSASFFR